MANPATANQAVAATEPAVLESQAGRIVTLTMNRPERLNALSAEMMTLLYDALAKYDSDPAVGAIVITGAGRGFCAGGDVKSMSAGGPPPARQERIEYLKRAHRIPLAIKKSSKVVIAQVNGPATGAGLSIALACDLRIAARSARFGAVFAQVGLAGDFGISHSLIQVVGPAMARQMLLSAEIIDANRALEIGLINYLVDDAALPEETRKLAQRYADGPTLAFNLIKQNLLDAETSTFAQSLDFEADTQTTVLLSADHKEAVSAFLEKRKGNFKGQ